MVVHTQPRMGDLVDTAISSTIRSMTFYTDYSKPVTLTGRELAESYRDKTPNKYLSDMKPTIILDTVFGQRVVAPYGKADPENYRRVQAQAGAITFGLVLVTAAAGLGLYLLGERAGRRQK